MIGDKIDALLADKGYDADAVRQALSEMEVEAIIPSKSNRKQPIAFDREAYKRRNLIERMFNKLKNWRRGATRYDKTASSFLAFIMIASAKLCLLSTGPSTTLADSVYAAIPPGPIVGSSGSAEAVA